MSSKPRTGGSLAARVLRLVDELGVSLGFAPGSRWWWFVLLAAIVVPIVVVVMFAGDEPLISPFVYRT
jgi:hypothetical protein